MRQRTLIDHLITGFLATFTIVLAPSSTAQVGVERDILLREDLAIPGYEAILMEVTVAVGAREGRHSHPGTLVGRVLEGEVTLELEGQPTKVVRAGEAVLIAPDQIHEGINNGGVPIRALVTLIVEKDKPLATPAP